MKKTSKLQSIFMFYCSVSRISINDFLKSVSSIMLLLNELNLIFYSYYFITKISFLFFCLPKIHQFYYKKLNLPVTWQHSWHRNWLYFLITITVSLFDISKTFLHLIFFFFHLIEDGMSFVWKIYRRKRFHQSILISIILIFLWFIIDFANSFLLKSFDV